MEEAGCQLSEYWCLDHLVQVSPGQLSPVPRVSDHHQQEAEPPQTLKHVLIIKLSTVSSTLLSQPLIMFHGNIQPRNHWTTVTSFNEHHLVQFKAYLNCMSWAQSCCKMPQISETASVISQSPHICKLRIERIWQNTPISCSYFSLVSLWMLRKYCHCSLFSCKSALFDKIGNISFKTTLVIG